MFESPFESTSSQVTPEKIALECGGEEEPTSDKKWEEREAGIKDFARKKFDERLARLARSDEDRPDDKRLYLHSDIRRIEDKISELAGSQRFKEAGVYDEDMRRGLHVFMETLVDFVKENHSDIHIEAFAEGIKEDLFSMSPDISEGLSVADHFELLAHMTRIPELQGNIGMNSLGALVYKSNWSSKDSMDKILDKIKQAPAAEQMDMLEVAEAIFAQSLAEGWATNSASNFKDLVLKFDSENESFFVRQYLELIKERMAAEEDYPTQGVVKLTGNRETARLRENSEDEAYRRNVDRAERTFAADRHLLPREKIIRIGEDALAILDHTNKPIEIAKVDPTAFARQPLETKPRDLEDLDRAIEAFRDNPDAIRFDVLLMVMSQNSIFPDKSIDSWERLAEEWEATCGEIKQVQLDVVRNAPHPDNQSVDNDETPMISRLENVDLARDGATAYLSPEEKKVMLDHDLAEKNWIDILQDLKKANRLSEADKRKIMDGLSRRAQAIHAEQEGKFTEADFMDYDQLMRRYNYEFMKKENPEDIFLLLQHLHKPDMKQKIESQLDISLAQVPFIFQLHFLKFLSEKNEDEVMAVRDFLSHSTDDRAKIDRIKSFLSLEAGDNMGAKILHIDQQLEPAIADNIYEKYAEIVSQFELSQEAAADMFGEETDITPGEIRDINEGLVNRANRLIIDFSHDIDNAESAANMESDIIAKLSRINAENVLFSAIFKTAYESGGIKKFEDIRNLDLEIKSSAELSQDEKDDILKIVEMNYGQDRARCAKIVAGITASFGHGDSRWYLLKKKDGQGEAKIISTMQFAKTAHGDYYAGTFNVEDEFKGSAIGKAMNDEVLDSINETDTTVAISKIGDPCSLIHINHTGWIVTGTEKNEATDIDYYKIMRNKETRDANRAEKMEDSELIENFYHQNSSWRELLDKQEKKFLLKLDVKNPQDLATIDELSGCGYVVTRLVQEGGNATEIYHLFEEKGY